MYSALICHYLDNEVGVVLSIFLKIDILGQNWARGAEGAFEDFSQDLFLSLF